MRFGEISINTLGAALLGGGLTLLVTFLFVRYLIPFLKVRGISGKDVHKPHLPEVPEMGGLGLVAGLIAGIIPIGALFPEYSILVFTLLACVISSSIVGLIDDLRPLKAWQKPLLMMIPALFVYVIMYLYPVFWPRLYLPIVGWTRLTIVYPLLIPIAFSVCSNTVNMMDVYNGSMTGSMTIIFTVLGIASFFLALPFGLISSVVMLGGVGGLFYWNRYPSKIFCGDTGALAIGSGLACVAIMGSMEVIAVIAILPFIMNSFHSLASVGGLFERHEMKIRPVIISKSTVKDGQQEVRLTANPDPKAPLTLTRLILAKSSLTERDIVKGFFLLTLFSGILALTTAGIILFMGA